MRMTTRSDLRLHALALALVAGPAAAQTTFTKADNTTSLNAAGSYTANSGVPSSIDTILIDNTLSANRTSALGGNLSVNAINMTAVPISSVSRQLQINATTGATLTIHGGGITKAADTSALIINSAVKLGANQTWTLNSFAGTGTGSFQLNTTSFDADGRNLSVLGNGLLDLRPVGSLTLGSTVTIDTSVNVNAALAAVTLGGANTLNSLNIVSGKASGATIGNFGVASNFGDGGTNTVIGLGGTNTSGVFEYTGSTASSNRTFAMDRRSSGNSILVTNSATTLTLSGNITNNTGNATGEKNVALTAGGAGNLILSGVISEHSGAFDTSLVKQDGGTLTLSNANTFAGGTTVSAGTLLVNNTTGSGTGTGAVTVNGGTVGGNGSIAGALTVNATATLAPGNSTGLLTVGSLDLNANSSTNLEIDGVNRGQVANGYDALNINTGGSIDLAGALSFSFGNLSAFAANTEFDLFSFDTSSTGDFTAVTSTGFYTGSWSKTGDIWSLTDAGQTLNFSELTGNLTVVPEPTAALLGSVGVLLLLRRRRN